MVDKKYAKRWKIDGVSARYYFKHLKTNGFNLEDMSLIIPTGTDYLKNHSIKVISLYEFLTIELAIIAS